MAKTQSPVSPKSQGKRDKTNRSKRWEPVNPNAAGIDIGATQHWVAIPEGRDESLIRPFESFTADLHRMANWLKKCGIETVAMESTGVYWIPVFQILESYGLEVKLVNAQHVKTVPGRKTDVMDCQWIQQLHTVGLLSSSFRPENEICVLRSYLRHREALIRLASSQVQRMHKALTQMNLQIQNVISDMTGLTGRAILQTILRGERNPCVLAQLIDPRIKSSPETIEKSLEGDYREEHPFVSSKQWRRITFINGKSRNAIKRLNSISRDWNRKWPERRSRCPPARAGIKSIGGGMHPGLICGEKCTRFVAWI